MVEARSRGEDYSDIRREIISRGYTVKDDDIYQIMSGMALEWKKVFSNDVYLANKESKGVPADTSEGE